MIADASLNREQICAASFNRWLWLRKESFGYLSKWFSAQIINFSEVRMPEGKWSCLTVTFEWFHGALFVWGRTWNIFQNWPPRLMAMYLGCIFSKRYSRDKCCHCPIKIKYLQKSVLGWKVKKKKIKISMGLRQYSGLRHPRGSAPADSIIQGYFFFSLSWVTNPAIFNVNKNVFEFKQMPMCQLFEGLQLP